MEKFEELNLYELKTIQGGFLGTPPKFITDTAVFVGRSVTALWRGFINGTESF